MNFFSKGSKKQKLTLFGGKKGNSVDWFTLPKLLTIKKVCELLEVHPNTLRNWDISGKLPAVRVGARKDRRYERDTIKRMYESLHPVAPLAHAPHTQLPAPSDGGKYVLKPGLSATKVKLLLISKKFTFFVYSTTIVAFTFVVVQMFFFAHVFVVQAEVAQVTPKILKLAPSSATGWENPNNAQQLDVISSGEINQFTPKNSATYVNRPVVVKGEETTVPSLAQMPTEEPSLIPPTNAPLTNSAPFTNTAATNTAAALSTTNPDLELGGFTVPGEISPDSVINDATLDISFGGQTYPDNEDVVTFSYSMDGGTSWQPLDSFAMTATVSNATHDGYWQYPLADKIASLQNLDSFRIKINYNAVPGPQEAAAYVDGVILNLTITEPPSESTVQQLDQSVTLDKQDFTAEEAPTLNVEVEKKSKLAFLGAKPTTREVKSLTITSPTGETTEVDAAGTATTEKNTTTAEYQIDLKELSAPGAYTITTTIEQNGYIREVTETFVWGALAMNTDKSLYQQGDTAHFSIGAVDDRGQTVCNADMDITITDPQGKKSILSTANGGVTVTDYCHQKELYQGPDYTGDFAINQTGAYTIDLRATVNGNVRTLSDAFTAENKPEFMLRRDGPTRVFPVVEQPMTLTVTVAQDFQGIIREFVPAEYTVRPENGGYEQPFDLGGTIARTIVWDVNLKAGSTVTLKYFFKAPDKSPALFFLGPARVGDWEELRAWQQAIDPAYMFLLATSSSAATGWTNQTTYDGASARFLRAAATYSGTGGAATHTPTVTGATVATTNDGLDTATCSLRCSSRASYGHTHTTTAPTAGAANNDPAYYSFYLWKSNAQNPTTIPQNTFMFSTTAQSGSWTQFSAANDRLVKLTNSHTTGGSDTHTHAMTSWGSLAASSGTILVGLVVLDTPPNLAGASHTHTAPGNSTSDSKTSLPPYVTTRIYQQTNATPQTIPQNMVGMFDADPGTGWDVVSDASPYLNNMVRGHATTAESTGGSATHNDTASTTSPANTTSDGSFAIGTDGAADDHTHTVTATITAGSDHTPPYVNFVLAKCTSASGCSGSSTYSVSGNVYSDEGSTLIGGTPTVRLLVNGSNTACGGGACTASVSSGSYTISNITTTSGDVLLLYLDTAGSPLATTVTVGSGANLTGINLYQNSLIVRHETGTSVTNANIATGIGSYSDTDILASVSTNNLTVANNTELHIWTGKTYDPNGTVTTQGTGDLHVDDSATAYLDTATSTINNNIAVDTGATLNVQATTTVNGAAAGGVTTAGTLNHTAGTFTIGNGTDEDLNVTAGTTTLSGGNTVIKDDINNCASGTLNINTGSNVDALSTTGIVNMGNGCSASAILNFNGGSLDVGQHMFLDAGTVNLNGGTHRAGVSADGIVEFARYANGGMTLNMTGGELVGRAIIVYNGETLTTTTVTGGTLTVDDLNGTVSAATWYQWSDDSPKFYNLQFNDTANAIDASSQLTYLNGSLTNNSAALTTNSKNITLEGNFTNNGSITIGTSTVILAGTSQQTVTGTTTFSTLTVTNNSGSDAQTSPSVIFADGYNYSVGTLNVTTGNAKLRFPQGPTYSFAVTGTLNLNSSDANKIYLRSNASGTQWRFNVSGSPVVYDVDVKDSNAIGSAIDATDATNVNSTNNTNWNFGGTISIGGTANGNDAATVMVAINGTPQAQTGTIGSGTWTISGVTPPSAGQTITVWVDNVTDANESTGITKWASGNVTGMVLNTNVVTIGSNQNQTLTVTEATQYTGASDEDVMHRLNSTTLATDLFSAYSTDQLSILASNGLTIGSTQILDTYDLNNAGTLTSTTTAAYYIRGSWTNSGTFTCGTSTVTFASQATGKTINTGGTGATKDFYNVTFEGTGGTWSPLTNTMVVTNDLNMNAGTLNNATGTANIQVNGNVQCGTGCGTITLGSGTFTMSTSGGVTRMLGTNAAVAIDWMFNNLTLTSTSGANTVRTNATGTGKIIVNGNLSLSNSGTSLTFDNETNDRILDITTLNIPTNTVFQASSTAAFTIGGNVNGGGGTFTPGTGTVTLDATTTNHWINFGSSLYNLVLNGSGGGWYNDQSNLTVTNDLTVTNGTLSSGGFNVTVGGHVQCGATCGTITLNSGTFTQSVSASKNFGTNVAVATNWTFYNLAFVNASGSNSITMNGTGTGQIIVSNNLSMTNSGTVLVVDDNTNDRIFDIANDVSIGAGVSFEASSSASFTVGGSWTNAGPFVHNSGTITFDAGTTGKTITDGGYNFGSITFNNAAGGWSFADSTTLSGDLTMTAGTLSGTNDITVNGGDAAGNGTINLTGGTFTLVGDGNFSGATGWTFYDLTFGLGGLCSGADYTTNAGGTGQVTITHTFDQGSCYCGETCSSVHYLSAAYGGVAKTWELSGTGTPVSYLILANNDTENSTFKYTGSGSVTVYSGTYHNLELAAPTAQTYAYSGGSIYGNLSINGNTTLNAGSGSVHMKGTGTIDANDESFYDFSVDGTSNTVTVQNTGLTISRAISTSLGGTLTIGSNLTVSHTGVIFAVYGTINGAGTLRFTNTSAGPGTGGTVNSIVRYDSTDGNIANTTFDARTYGGDVEVYSNSGSARTVTMGAGTHTISGNLSAITGSSQSGTFSLDNSSTNPSVTATGGLSITKGGAATPGIITGTGTWTFGNSVNLSNSTFTATAGHTLVMNSTGTLTSNSQALSNLTLSGTITLANATHTVARNLTLSGTVTAGTSTVSMTGQQYNLVGGGNTLYNLNINNGGYDIYLDTSDLTLSHTLSFSSLGELYLNSGRTLTMQSTASSTGTGYISGYSNSLLIYQPSTINVNIAFINVPVRFDATYNNITINDTRSFSDAVTLYNSSGSPRTIYLGDAGGQTLNFNSLTLTRTSGALTVDQITNDPTVNVSGLFIIGAGTTFSATDTGTLNIKSSFTNSGTFTHNSGTVTMNGTSQQTITGTLTFNTLTISNTSGSDPQTSPSVIFDNGYHYSTATLNVTTGNVKLRFPVGPTFTFSVTSTLNLNSSDSNKIYLRSNTADTAWLFNVPLSQVVYDVDVKDSTASTTIDATDASNVDSGGNTNWSFTVGISISGTANGNNGAYVKVAINSTRQTGRYGIISGGGWSVNGITQPNTNDRITVWIEPNLTDSDLADSLESTAATVYDGAGNITGMVLNTNVLTLGSTSESAGLTGNSLTYYTNANDEDVMHVVDALTNGGSGIRADGGNSYTDESLVILANTTLTLNQVGGEFPYRDTLTTVNLTVNSTGSLVSSGSPYYNIYGTWANSGTFTDDVSTVYFKSTATGKTITPGGSPFYNVEFNGSGGGWTTGGTLAVANDLTMTLGTFTVSHTTTVTGDIITNGGTINGAGSITVNGGDISGTNGVISMSGGTITIPSASGNFGSDGAWTVNNLHLSSTVNCADRTTTGYGTGGVTVTNNLTTDPINDPGFSCSCMEGSCYGHRLAAGGKTWTFSGATPISNGGDIVAGSSTFVFTYGGALTVPGTFNYNNLYLQPSGTATYTIPSSIGTLSGNLLVGDGANAATINGATNNPAMAISGNVSCTAGATNTITSGTNTWTVGGDVDFSNCTYTATSGNTLWMNGASKTFTHNSQALYNFTTTGTIVMSSGNETVSHDLIMTGGSLTSTSGTLSVGGNFTNNSSTFAHNNGTVALTTSAAATITGNTTFYVLSVSGIGAAKDITFANGSTTTVSNTLTFDGASGQVVTVHSQTGGTAWNLRMNGTTQTIHYVSAQDSNACGGTYHIQAYDGTNTNVSGNTCWDFTSITISGTSSAVIGTVAVAFNSARQSQQASTNGNWTLTVGAPSANDIITVWLDGTADTSESTGITEYDGSGNITGMSLVTNTLTLGSTSESATLTRANLLAYDYADDEDVMQGAAENPSNCPGTTLAEVRVDATGSSYTDEQLVILANTTLTLSGYYDPSKGCHSRDELDARDVTNLGTITMVTDTGIAPYIDLTGFWDSDAATATFNSSQETIFFGATTGTENIATGGDPFYNVKIDGAGTYSLTDALTVANDLTTSAGTLSGTQNLNVQGGDIVCSGTCGTINLTGGTATLSGTGNFGTNALTSNWTFYNLTFSGNAQTTTSQGTGTTTVTNALSIGSGHTLDAGAKTWTLSGTGTPFTLSGSLTASTSTFQYQNTTSVTATAATYYNLSLNPGSGTPTYTLQNSTYTVGGNLVINSNITLTPGTSTVSMTGTSKTADTNSRTLYNFNTSGTATVTLTSAMVANNDVAVGSGTTLSGAQNLTVNGGDFTGAGTVNFTGGTVTIGSADGTIGGTGASPATDWNLANVTLVTPAGCANNITTSTAAGASAMKISGQITGASCSCGAECNRYHYLYAGAKTWDLTYNGQALWNLNMFPQTSTFRYVGTSAMTLSSNYYYDLVLQPPSSQPTYTLPFSFAVAHNLTTANTSTVTLSVDPDQVITIGSDGVTSTLDAHGQTLSRIAQNGSNIETLDIVSNLTARSLSSNLFDTMLISSGVTVTLPHTDDISPALAGFGTINDVSDNGLIIYRDVTAPSANLTVNCNIQFDAVDTNQSISAGTWGGNVTVNNSGTTAGRTVTLGAGTHNFSGNLVVQSDGTGGITLAGATNNPDVNITGYLDFGNTNGKTITSGSGTWTASSDIDLDYGTYTASTGNTLVMNGADNYFYHGSNTFYNFTAGGGIVSMNTGNLTVSNDLTINNGATLWSTPGILSIGHNFSNSGTFYATGGTVALTTSAAATLSGNTTFNNLSVTGIGAAKTVNFTGNTTTTVGGTFTITGASGQVVTLQSTDTNSWTINQSAASVDYASVSRSTNTGPIFCATNSTDGGNNINWNFSGGASCGVVVSGTVYTNEGSSTYNCSTDNLSVKAVVNGSTSNTATCLGSGGTYGMYISATAGQPIVVYLDGETPDAATVTRYNSGTITGLNLYQNRVIVRYEDAGPITNANLGTYDHDNDADIPFTSNSNNLVVNAGTKLFVWANKTFTPGGTVTTTAASAAANPDGDIYIAAGATMSVGAYALSVGGDFVNAGTFSHTGTQTTTFTATDAGFTITPNGSAFHNLTFNGSGGIWSPSATLDIDNDLTVTAGALFGSQSINVGGAVTGAGIILLTGGTFTHQPAASVSFGTTSGSSNWTFSTLTFSNAAASAPTTTLASGGSGQIIVNSSLNLTNAGTSLILNANTNDRILNVDGTVTIGAGTTLEASNSAAFNIGGDWTNSGTFTHNSGTITFDAGSTGKTITDGGADWGNVTFNNAAGGWSFADSTTLSGDLTMTAGTLSGTNDITVNGGDATGNGTINLTGGTFNLNNTGNFSGGSTAWTFYDLHLGRTIACATTTTTATGTGEIVITHALDYDSCVIGENNYVHQLSAASGSAKTWTLSGTGSPLNAALINYDTENSTFQFTGTGSPVTVPGIHYHTLKLLPASSTTYNLNNTYVYGNFQASSNAVISHASNFLEMNGDGTTLDAGGNSFYNFSLHGSNSTVTVANTDFTVTHALIVYSTNTLSISSGRTVSDNAAAGGLIQGTVSGAGTLQYSNVSGGPGTAGTINCVVRYNASNGNISSSTFDTRTYGGDVEIYSDSSNARSVTIASGTSDIAGNLKFITGASQSQGLTLDNSTTNPTINLTGDMTATKGGSGTIGITTGTGTWAVAGNVNFTDIGLTAAAGHTLQMNGSGKSITSTGQTLQNFAVTGGSVSSADAMDVNGTFSVTSGGFTQHATSNLNVADDFTLENGTTFTYSATSGVLIFDGDLVFNDKNTTKQNMGDVEIGTSPDTTDLASDFSANKLTVKAGDIFNSNGYDLDIGNKGVDVSGTFDATDDVETDTTTINTEGDFIINSGATFTQSDSKVIFDDTSGTDNLITDGSFSLYDLELNDGGNSLIVEVEDPLSVQNNLTITGGTLDTVSGENNNINVGGNWTNSDTFTANSATVTFDGTATGKTINPGSSSFYNLTFNGAGGAWSPLTNTITVTNDLIMTAGTFDTSNGTANVTVNGNVQCLTTCGTINMTSTNTFTQSVAADKAFGTNISGTTAWTFYNLTFTGASGARTIMTNGTATGAINVAHDLSLTNSGTSLALDNNTNDRALDVGNDVSIAANTTLSSSSSATFTVGGNWANSGTFTHNNGTVTFDAGSGTKSINPGSSAFYILTFNNAGGTWRPATNTLTLANNLNVTAGTMDNETNDRILDVGGDVTIGGTGVLQASSTADFTVAGGWTNAGTFTANSGLVKFDATSGTKSVNSTGATTASFNNLTLDDSAGSAVFQLGSALDVNGNLLITGGTLDTTSGSNWGITVGGNWTNNDIFTANSGLVTADGAAQQTFSGTTSGSSGKFYDLTITNASGSDPDTSPSVIFSGDLETANTFTANTANTKLRFNATSTYTLQNISFNGQAQHTRLSLRSSSGGSAWNLNVAGTRYVRNTDAKDSYACGQAPDIDATHISNKNSNGNSCWDFTALTFTLSTNNLNLGTLTTGSVTTASHTVQTVTSADNGYVTYVYVDGNLLDGSNTIDAATGTLSAGTEGYGIATSDAGQTITQDTGCGSAPYNVTAMTTSQQAVAGANSGPVDETSTICFQAAISSNTVAGNYSQTVTYVTVGLF